VFLLSDAAGLLGGLTRGVSLLTILAVLLVPLSFFVLWRTAFGLRLRSVGENPVAADSLGVPVYRLKYAAVVASGAFAGLGGAALVVGSIYREGQTAGRGFIGLAPSSSATGVRAGSPPAPGCSATPTRRAAAAPRRRVGARAAAAVGWSSWPSASG
jgi:ABC-type uncharacterized transport system permease subunit